MPVHSSGSTRRLQVHHLCPCCAVLTSSLCSDDPYCRSLPSQNNVTHQMYPFSLVFSFSCLSSPWYLSFFVCVFGLLLFVVWYWDSAKFFWLRITPHRTMVLGLSRNVILSTPMKVFFCFFFWLRGTQRTSTVVQPLVLRYWPRCQ